MEKTLEGLIYKTKSHLKKATLGAIILTSISGNSAERTQDTQEATYNYFSQEANQSSNFSQSKQGLYEKFELGGISSTGNYQTESPQPPNSMTIKNSIEQSPGKISFSYDLTQNTQTNGQKLFEENSSRTNVYFAVPRGALEGIYQEVSVFDYSKKEKKTLFATDGANQRLEEQLGKFNRTIAKLKGKSSQNLNKERNEYEAALDHAIDLAPGKIGLGLKAGKNLLKKLGQKNEERRIQNLQEKLGEDYEIIRMPSNSTNGSLSELFFTHGITGRKTTLLYSPGKIKEGQKIHISVPNLTFTKMQNGLERTTEIGGLEYEITLDKEKNVGEEIYGDWVLAPENWGIDNKKYLQYSFKENAKGNIDVQIILNDSKDKTYFSKNCQSTIKNLNPEFFVRTGNYPGRYKYNDFRSLEEGEIKDAEKFYKDWWDKKILLNSWTPEGTKSVEDIKSLHIKLIGKNRLIYSKNFDEKKGMIEERGLYFMVRKNSKMESSNFEDLQGMWVRKFRKKGLSGTNIVISKNRISEYYPAWGGNQELINLVNLKNQIIWGQ
jgi:hypothetical protein